MNAPFANAARLRGPIHRTAARPLSVLMLALLGSGCLSDLRPKELRQGPIRVEQEEKGRELLRQAAGLQGLEAWQATDGTTLVMSDHWNSKLMAWFAVPWKPGQPFKFETLRGKQAGRLIYLDGNGRSQTHQRASDGMTFVTDSEGLQKPTHGDEIADFFIPAIRYLHDFPFRILEATIFAYAGTREFEGRTFDRVFATWKSAEPNSEFDQYLIWVARDTGRVEIIEYSSRKEFRFSRYCTVFDHFETNQGITLPNRITILDSLSPDYARDYLHQFRVESTEYGPFLKGR